MTRRFRIIFISALIPATVACGKKGPPLAPLRVGPAQVEALAVRRFGSDVYLHFTIPTKNQDNTTPADVTTVRAYGVTLKPDTRRPEPPPLEIRELIKVANEIGRIDVRPPPVEEERTEEDPDESEDEKARRAARRAEAAQADTEDPRPPQGARVTLVERLTPETFTLVERPVKGRQRTREVQRDDSTTIAPLFTPAGGDVQTRTYVVVGFNRKAQEGQPSTRIQVPLVEAPPAPPAPRLSYTEKGVVIRWQRPSGLRRRAQEPHGLDWDELRPDDGPIEPPVRHGVPEWVVAGPPLSAKPVFADAPPPAYNVYELAADPKLADPKPEEKTAVPPVIEMPKPLNAAPLEVTQYDDSRIEFEKERCYVVRTVETHGDVSIESDPSPKACVTPQDVFPPPPPTNLAAVASEGGISLIWEGSAGPDLAGYLVLRAEAPSGAPKPVTTEPTKETTFRDTSVKPGIRYIYVVVAVDTATPPNMSAQSNRVEETAR